MWLTRRTLRTIMDYIRGVVAFDGAVGTLNHSSQKPKPYAECFARNESFLFSVISVISRMKVRIAFLHSMNEEHAAGGDE